MKDFHPRKIVLWVHVLPLTINGSCCLLVRSAAWLRGFRVSPERVTVRRAPYASAGGASTDLDMRAVVYAIPNIRTVHGLQYSKLTTTNATPCNAVIHTTARVSADQYQVRSLSVLRAGVDGPAVRGAVTLTDSISLARPVQYRTARYTDSAAGRPDPDTRQRVIRCNRCKPVFTVQVYNTRVMELQQMLQVLHFRWFPGQARETGGAS